MRVLVTGGAGRLGVTVCRKILEKEFQVRVFDLDNPRNRKSVGALGNEAEVFWGDITYQESVHQALDNTDAVVHMAGILPPVSEERPGLAKRVNVDGTRMLVDLLRERDKRVPLVFTSSVAVFGPTPDASRPISVEENLPRPDCSYGQTKLQAEQIIKQSGIDYVILRLSAAMYTIFGMDDMKRVFSIPLNNRVETCHPDDVAVAVVNALSKFDDVKGETLIVSGGPGHRMLYGEMIEEILNVIALPVPPAEKFNQEPCYLDWYDTSKSQELLAFQHKSFGDYVRDYRKQLTRKFSPLFLPFMTLFVGPLFGKAIVRFM